MTDEMSGLVCLDLVEETEHLIGLASDWLQLDSPDEGVRFDAELVSRLHLQELTDIRPSQEGYTKQTSLTPTLHLSHLSMLDLGLATRTSPRSLPQRPNGHPSSTSQPSSRGRLRSSRQCLPAVNRILHPSNLDPHPHLGSGRAHPTGVRRWKNEHRRRLHDGWERGRRKARHGQYE